MQTAVRSHPRTGREPKWYFEVYRGSQQGPAEQGEIFDFEEVKTKIRVNLMGSPNTIIRVIGPSEATAEQLDELRRMGATPTFP